MSQIILPNDIYNDGPNYPEKPIIKIFLAGTIDNGNSYDWQYEMIINLSELEDYNFKIYNPRRVNWNPHCSDSDLKYQIKWELEHLDESDIIIMYLDDESKSPISLLELGLYAQSKKLFVICGKDFYRKMNVFITCQKYDIPYIIIDEPLRFAGNKNWNEVIEHIKNIIELIKK